MNSVVVFCGSSEGLDPQILEDARVLGNTLAEKNIKLVYGAARIGVMGHLAQSCLDANGKVVGVIPDFLMLREVYHSELDELIITVSMHERKTKMHELSDGIIMLPGGYGTLEEFFEMITWAQLGLHQKPVGILNTNGFYNELLAMLKKMVAQGFLKQANYDMILVEEDIDMLLRRMNDFVPIPVPKWIKKDQI